MRKICLVGLVLATGMTFSSTAMAQGNNASTMGMCSRAFAQAKARPFFNEVMRMIAKENDVPMGAVVAYLANGGGNCTPQQ